MAKRNPYKDSIPWKRLQNLLLALRQKHFLNGMKADGLQAVGQAQGRALMLNDLLSLPEMLLIQDEGIPDEGETTNGS